MIRKTCFKLFKFYRAGVFFNPSFKILKQKWFVFIINLERHRYIVSLAGDVGWIVVTWWCLPGVHLAQARDVRVAPACYPHCGRYINSAFEAVQDAIHTVIRTR